jgi:hypothetical protein
MGEDSLQALLARVQQHLGSGGHVDSEARAQLGSVLRELEGGGAQPAAPRLESLAVKFEVSHPALAETLREVIDALGKAGI